VSSTAEADSADLTADEEASIDWSQLNRLSPLPAPPVDTTNKYADSAAAALLGQKLFFDKRISGPIQTGTPAEGQLGAIGDVHKIACADCHQPSSGWLFDKRSNNGGPIPNATALGSAWMSRNVSSLVNTVFYVQGSGRNAPHWRENDGFSDSEWFDAQSEPEGAPVQNGSRLQLIHLIADHYSAEYNAAFGADWPLPDISDLSRFPATGSPFTDVDNWNGMAPADQEVINRALANYGKAMEAFLRTLVSRNAPFDQYVAGNKNAISNDAKRGLKLFTGKAGCIHCHNGPLFSDDDFHTIGLKIDTTLSPHADPTEVGRVFNQGFICDSVDSEFNVNGPYSDDSNTTRLAGFCDANIPAGLWRTKTLRQVAETGPYMRDGQFATLDDVIDFYDRGGDPNGTFFGTKEIQPLHLGVGEKRQLKAFLKSLTGDPVPASRLTDIHNP
jgi:cytochrome c peroxidase